MMIQQLTKRRDPLGPLDTGAERILCHPHDHPNALADLLMDLYRAQVWLCCPCGWTFHVRQGSTLARHPGQPEPEGDPCSLCVAWPYQQSFRGRREGETIPDESGLSLIATGRRRTTGGSVGSRASGGFSRMKYWTMFRVLWSVMQDSGFVSLGSPLAAGVCWQRVREVLALTPLHEGEQDGLTYADVAWMPDSMATPEEVLARVESFWRTRGVVQPQVWIFGILDQIPSSTGGYLRIDLEGDHGLIGVDLPARNRKVIGETGPHMVLVQATRGVGEIRYDKLAAQAILSTDCPVPVDSGYERDAIRVVQDLGLDFLKPVFPVVDDLKPDLLLLSSMIILEVQGMTSDEYIKRKKRVHARMCSHPAFRRWRLMTYEARHGESPRDLAGKLRRWWRGPAQR